MIPADVERFLVRAFSPADQDEARGLLGAAILHDGSLAGPRLIRCAAVASGGSIERLRMEVETLKHDYRDVIVEGEYIVRGDALVKVRDLNAPIPEEG
jgi:hypothetical protein